MYPFVLGSGELLFGVSTDRLSLHLVDNRTVGDGLAYVVYEVVRATERNDDRSRGSDAL